MPPLRKSVSLIESVPAICGEKSTGGTPLLTDVSTNSHVTVAAAGIAATARTKAEGKRLLSAVLIMSAAPRFFECRRDIYGRWYHQTDELIVIPFPAMRAIKRIVKHFRERPVKRDNYRLGCTVTRLSLQAAGLVASRVQRASRCEMR